MHDGTSRVDLVLRGVRRSFGHVQALSGVDLTASAREILTILGPSGSGKTTLLKLVAGFDMPDAGTILLGGTDITRLTPAKRHIGMVFQNYALFPHMTVAENIAFPLEMRRMAKAAIREKVARVLALVELADYGARLPKQLSGGQQQRVALARAVVFDPALLLLDEPFGALDQKLREQMQLEVKQLQRKIGLTAIFVTHDQVEALVLSDRIAIMNHGKVEQVGAPFEVYTTPSNRFVAQFIGASNIFRARVADSGTGRLPDGTAIELPREHRFAAGADVAVILRPERLQPWSEAQHRSCMLTGRVVETVYLGESLKYRIATPAGDSLNVRWPVTGQSRALEPGSEVRLGWDRDEAHLVPWDA